jgi:hypothetical protein
VVPANHGAGPYGQKDIYNESLFDLKKERVWVNETIMWKCFTQPRRPNQPPLQKAFSILCRHCPLGTEETEKAVLYVINHRNSLHPHNNFVMPEV